LTAPLSAPLTGEEQAQIMSRLAPLLKTQAEKYLAGDSTSLPAETAEALLRSLVYTLRFALEADGLPERALLTAELPPLLLRGQAALAARVEETHALWSRVCLTAPPLENVFYRDTLTELGRFFGRYDLRYFAHRIPCAIDYPLCVPVSESLEGVSYVGEWLRRLALENWFLSRFPAENAASALARCCPDYKDMPLNLCEPVLTDALGLAALDRDIFPLTFSAADRDSLRTVLRRPGAPDAAAQNVLAQLAPCPIGAAAYVSAFVSALRPRLAAALETGGLGGVFT